MKKVAKERKRRERALKRWAKKSWITERLKNKRIYLDLIRIKAKQKTLA
jgi:hypothetical protein